MLLEIDEETRDFKSMYNKHYQGKSCSRVEKIVPSINYKFPCNAINGPFVGYLSNLQEKNGLREDEEVNGMPLINFIKHETANSLKSNYQNTYCIPNDKEKKSEILSLPLDCYIPETSYKKSYRDCQYLDILESSKPSQVIEKPRDNLRPDFKQREILRVKTGVSEYSGVIGLTGKKIWDERVKKK